MANFWKNAGIMTIAELFLKLKALIMMPFITKYLGTVNYGIWSQVMVIVSLVSPLVFCGMDNSLARFLPGKRLDVQKKEFTGWLLFGLVSSLFILFFIALSRGWLSKFFFSADGEYPLFVLLSGVYIATTAMLTGVRQWFRIQNQAWSLVALTVMQNLIQMFVLIIVLVMSLGIYELILGGVIVDVLLILGYITYLFLNDVFKRPSIDWLKPYFRFGVVFLPSGYAIWVLNSLDRVFLVQYHTLADIGIYSICFTIGYTLIQIVVNPIWSLFFTKASELYSMDNLQEFNTLFNQSIKLICWIIFPSIFGLILTGDILLSIISTDDFSKGYLVIPIILAGYLFLMLSAYFESILILKNKPFLSTIFTFIACIANVILNFALIPKFSYIGAAAATALSFALQLVLSVVCALRENVVTVNIAAIKKILTASVIMVLVVFFVKKNIFYDQSIFLLMILSSAGVSCYLFLTQVLNIYKFKDISREFTRNFTYG